MLWPTLIAGVGGLGVAEAVAYFASHEDQQRSTVLSTSLVLGLAQSVVLVLAGLLLLPYVLSDRSPGLLRMALFYLWIIPLYPLTLYPLSVLQGRMELAAFNISRLSVSISYTCLLVALAWPRWVTIQNALAASLASSMIALIVVAWFVLTKGYMARIVHAELWPQLLAFGGKLHIGNIAGLVVARIDIVALTFLASSAELGSYVVATALGMTASLIPTSVSMVTYPLFSRQDPASLPLLLSRFLLVAGVLAACAGPILVIALPWTLPFLFGPTFRHATAMAQILVVAYLLRGSNTMLTSVVRSRNRPLRASLGEVFGLAVMVLLIPVLTPRFGGIGTAYSVAASAIVMMLWMIVQSVRTAGLTAQNLVQYWAADIRQARYSARR
jgi:O-antigen/teichoic acid export membrane protein